jgi:hypothetical protein
MSMLLALAVCSQFQLAVDRALLEVINRSVLGLKLTSHGDEICHRYMQDGFYRAPVRPSSYSTKIDMRPGHLAR